MVTYTFDIESTWIFRSNGKRKIKQKLIQSKTNLIQIFKNQILNFKIFICQKICFIDIIKILKWKIINKVIRSLLKT